MCVILMWLFDLYKRLMKYLNNKQKLPSNLQGPTSIRRIQILKKLFFTFETKKTSGNVIRHMQALRDHDFCTFQPSFFWKFPLSSKKQHPFFPSLSSVLFWACHIFKKGCHEKTSWLISRYLSSYNPNIIVHRIKIFRNVPERSDHSWIVPERS